MLALPFFYSQAGMLALPFMHPFDQPEKWHTRRLPHFEGGEILQFITFRLFDSVPQEKIKKWKLELADSDEIEAQIELGKRIERYADQGLGNAFLKNKLIAEIVRETLFFWKDKKYKLIAWVIMPNHVHLLLRPREGFEVSEIMHSIKSFTANKANKLLKRKGDFWQHESFDRFIRNYEHYERVISYIENNPVKANLCEKPGDWIYSSAYQPEG